MKSALIHRAMNPSVPERWALWLAALVLLFTMTAQGQERQALNGHVPRVVTRLKLQPTGRLPGETRLHLAIGLP